MRKFIISLLLASVAASPVMAFQSDDDSTRESRAIEEREERQKAREERRQSHEESQPAKVEAPSRPGRTERARERSADAPSAGDAKGQRQRIERQPVERQPVERQPVERQPVERQQIERQRYDRGQDQRQEIVRRQIDRQQIDRQRHDRGQDQRQEIERREIERQQIDRQQIDRQRFDRERIDQRVDRDRLDGRVDPTAGSALARESRQRVDARRQEWDQQRAERLARQERIRNERPPVVSPTPKPGTQPPPPPVTARPSTYPTYHWSSNHWRNDRRYNWHKHRNKYWWLFQLGWYYDPFGWGYQPYNIGWRMWPSYYSSQYWINDPWEYRLPYAPAGTRWIRYWDDAVLVDLWSGQVVDVIYNFFW
jgi:hypothetical protein